MNKEPVVSALCVESKVGKVKREVRPLYFTPENLKKFWEKSKNFKTLFGREIGEDFHRFISVLANPRGETPIESTGLFWVIDDFVGVFYLTDIQPGIDAKVHYSFFDKKHIGRVKLTREMVKYVFGKYKFRRLTAEIPYYASNYVFKFVEEVGFTKEGRKRKAALYDNNWFDINCYGILKEETDSWA